MKFKNTKVLLILLGALLLAVFLPQISDFFGEKIGSDSSGINRGKVLFDDFKPEDVNSVKISRGETSVSLELKDGAWWVDGNKADTTEVSKLLNGILAIEVLELVSKNPDNHTNLGVSQDSGYHVEFSAGDEVIDIIVGGRGLSVSTFYVRKSGADETYLVKGALGSVSVNVVKWRDKVVADVSSKNFVQVSLSGVETGVFASGDETWNTVEEAFSPLTAFGFLSAEEEEEFNGTWRKTTVELKFEDETVETLELYRAEDEYWVKGGEYYYKVAFRALASIIAPKEEE